MYFICEVIRDAPTGDEISLIHGAITGWEVRIESSKPHASVEFEYVVLDGTGFDLETTSVQDDGNGNPELFVDPAKVTAKDDEADIAQRIERMEFGKRLIAIMSKRNDAKSLTTVQITQFAADFADTNTALLNGSIGTAKALINAIVPDNIITFDADKTALLDEITANETRLGY